MTTTKEDYFAFVDQEEGELLAQSLIEEVLTKGQEVLFEKHIESQVLPYAVAFAKDTLLTIVQWEFYKRDPGRLEVETWTPDEEPQPATIDSWARAAISIKKATPVAAPPRKKVVEDIITPVDSSRQSLQSQDAGDRGSVVQANASKMSLASNNNSKKRSEYSLTGSTTSRLSQKIFMRGNSARKSEKSGAGEGSHLSAAAAAERAIMEENRKTTQRIQNIEADGGRPEFGYDSEGRVILVKKVAPSKLLTQGVHVRVLEEVETVSTKLALIVEEKPAAGGAHRKAAIPSKQQQQQQKKKKMRQTNNVNPGDLQSKHKLDMGSVTTSMATLPDIPRNESVSSMSIPANGFVPDTTLDIPPLADIIKLQPGVTLREGDVVKRGSGRKPIVITNHPQPPNHPHPHVKLNPAANKRTHQPFPPDTTSDNNNNKLPLGTQVHEVTLRQQPHPTTTTTTHHPLAPLPTSYTTTITTTKNQQGHKQQGIEEVDAIATGKPPMDTLISQVLAKAEPVTRPTPFPVMAMRNRGPGQ